MLVPYGTLSTLNVPNYRLNFGTPFHRVPITSLIILHKTFEQCVFLRHETG